MQKPRQRWDRLVPCLVTAWRTPSGETGELLAQATITRSAAVTVRSPVSLNAA